MSSRRHVLQVLVGLVVTLTSMASPGRIAGAQDASSAAVPLADGLTIVASGLTNPRGFLVGADGSLIIALAGTGGSRLGTTSVPDGPVYGGVTARVGLVTQGCLAPLAEGLPSMVGTTGRTLGVSDVAVLDDQLYALVAGGGRAHGNPRYPNGVYRIASDGSVELVADLGAWIRTNPVARRNPLEFDPEGIPTAMAAVNGEIWIVESNGGQVLRVTTDGTISRLTDLSSTREALADITPAPAGGAYIATLGPPPYARGSARILLVTADGTVTDAWTGRTAAIAVAVDTDGSLLALELATRTALAPPFFAAKTGRVVRQTGPNRAEVIARRLDRPTALEVGSDGAIYVAVPAIDEDNDGAILRINPNEGDSLRVPNGPWPTPMCPPAP